MKKYFMIIFIVFNFLGIMIFSKNSIDRMKLKKIKDLVSIAHSGVKYFHSLFVNGNMTEIEAKNHAKEFISTLRHGHKNKNYFWIFGYNSKILMHPYIKRLVGMNISKLKDSKDKNYLKKLRDICVKNGKGYVIFHWYYRESKNNDGPKIAYGKSFKPWQWIIFGSIYLEE